MRAMTIYHNPRCKTSRTVLQMIQDAGISPTVVEYLQNPPSRPVLLGLIAQAGLTPREAMRTKETLYTELGLNSPDMSDERLIDEMLRHPILINRPFVVAPSGTRLCRPAESVMALLE